MISVNVQLFIKLMEQMHMTCKYVFCIYIPLGNSSCYYLEDDQKAEEEFLKLHYKNDDYCDQ